MSGAPPRAAENYLRFVAGVALWTAAAALLGAVPTRRLGGEGALAAMAAGCGISALGAALGGLPLAFAPAAATAAERAARALLGTALRLLVALAGGLAAALSGRLAPAPLLVWLAASYVLLLVPETRYALQASGDVKRS